MNKLNVMIKPKVSIIIPAFNASDFIDEAVYSVLNQTYQNIEIIIIDDNSTDDTFLKAKKLENTFPELIKVYTNKGKGACAARNFAFTKSTGDYIQYLDADDLLHPSKIENQLRLFKQYGNKIVCSAEWGRFYDSIESVVWSNQLVNKNYDAPINFLVDSWNGKGMMAVHCWLVPRALIKKAGKWNDNLIINQDGEFFSRVLLNAKAIISCKNAKVFYRSGISSSITEKNKFSYIKAKSLLLSFDLYIENCRDYMDRTEVKKGIAQNYLIFMYQFYPLYPDLLKRAEEQFIELGFRKMWPVGGRRFNSLSNLIGFKNALRIVYLIKKIK
jgi:glycosyltransferase involved in cell wall biosynthesis